MFAEDLTPFFDVGAGFAVQAALEGEPVAAIMDVGGVDLYDGTVTTTAPSALVPTASIPNAADGQTLTVAGRTYRVRNVQLELPDGALTRLTLARVS